MHLAPRDPDAVADERITIRQQIDSASTLGTPYLVMNVLATIVATYGLLADSTAVVIGAMVIAQLLGPINGIALALVDGDMRLLRKALLAELVGAALVFAAAYLVALLHYGIPMSAEVLSRTRPSLLDLMIALGGGAAGAYAAASPKLSAGVVGVAIATALVPPLCSAAICLANEQPRLAAGAVLLFLINLVAIQFATSVVLWALGYHKLFAKEKSLVSFVQRNTFSAILILGLGYAMFTSLRGTLQKGREEFDIRTALEARLDKLPAARLAELSITTVNRVRIVIATVRTPFSFTPEQVKELQDQLPTFNGIPNELHIRSVLIKEADAKRYLHQVETPPDDSPLPPPVDSTGGIVP